MYSVVPGTPQWVELPTKDSRFAACQMPSDILERTKTAELIEIVLQYPFLEDIYAYNNYSSGLHYLSEHFNGLEELLKRKDGGKELMQCYKDSAISGPDEISGMDIKQYLRLESLEVLLSYTPVLSLCDVGELSALAYTKYEQKREAYTAGFKKDHVSNFYNCLRGQNRVVDGLRLPPLSVAISKGTVKTKNGSSVEVELRQASEDWRSLEKKD